MDLTSIAGSAVALNVSQTQQALQISILKKTMEIQSQGVMALLEAAAQPAAANLPAHLGQNINTVA